MSDEHAEAFAKDSDPHHILNRHRNKEGLEEHPEVKRFLEWKKKHVSVHSAYNMCVRSALCGSPGEACA